MDPSVVSVKALPDGTPCAGYARILGRRTHGGVTFFEARLREESVQLLLTRSDTAEYATLRNVPLGSLLKFRGQKGMTRAREHAICVSSAEIIWSCPRPLPDKQNGLRGAQRVTARQEVLITSDDDYRFALAVADMTTAIRLAFLSGGFREFRTGVLQRFFEGGLAKPFIAHGQAADHDYALSLTSELKLKRLLIAGAERVFEIAESFRNEGMDALHSPEFTLLECYAVDETCDDMMGYTEFAVSRAARCFFERFSAGTRDLHGLELALGSSFTRLPFSEAYARFVDPQGWRGAATIEDLCKRWPGQFSSDMPLFTWVMKVVERHIIPSLQKPTFLTGLPSGLSPLVKNHPGNPEESARAFLAIGGLFIADIYQDEHDPSIVRRALEEQARVNNRPVNVGYLEALEFGIPPTAGIGMGLNRLFMSLLPIAGLPFHIRETMLYPL